MRANYPATYAQVDMGAGPYFPFNVAALASMTNQQLEVFNGLLMLHTDTNRDSAHRLTTPARSAIDATSANGPWGQQAECYVLRIAYVFICFLTVDSCIPTSLLCFLPFSFFPPMFVYV